MIPYQQSHAASRPINKPHRRCSAMTAALWGHQGACSAPQLPFTQPSYPRKAARQCQSTLALRLRGFWRHTRTQVGVPPGFCKTCTHTRRNPYPWAWVRGFWGTGAGSRGKPQGYPCQSLTGYNRLRLHPVIHQENAF